MRGADLSNAKIRNVEMLGADFNGANFASAEVTSVNAYGADFRNANFSGANLSNAWLANAHLAGANFTDANVRGTTLNHNYVSPPPLREFTKEQLYSTASYKEKNLEGIGLGASDLTGWDFTGQNIQGANFGRSNFSSEQLYSTSSYQQKNLRGIQLWDGIDLSEWDFTGQDLTGANLGVGADLTGAKFTDAIITGVNFEQLIGQSHLQTLTKEQIYSTASYKQKNLIGIKLHHNNLRGIDLSGQDIRDAWLGATDLTGANLTGALIHASNPNGRGAKGGGVVFSPIITRQQFYSTGSYQQKDLRGIYFQLPTMNGWDLEGQNVSNSEFATDLRNANLTDAIVNETWFNGARVSKDQLYSTASYKNKNLRGLAITSQSISGWDFSGQDLTGVWFHDTQLQGTNFTDAIIAEANLSTVAFTKDQLYSTASYKQKQLRGILWGAGSLNGVDFRGQDLSNAWLDVASLTGTDFTDAIVNGTMFGSALSLQQLYSTASYRNKNLKGIQLYRVSLRNADLRGQRLSQALFNWFDSSSVSGADLSFADLREVMGSLNGATTRNTILPSGHVRGLELTSGESFVVHDDSAYSISVQDSFAMAPDSGIQLVLDGDEWASIISFESGITVSLDGTLDLQFEADVNVASQVGKTFDLFDWSGVSPTGQFHVTSALRWDLSQLYTTGRVVLLSSGALRGDFDGDGILSALDIDRLSDEVNLANGDASFDLDGSGVVDSADRTTWVHDEVKSYVGDANLDGQFDSADMVAVFQSGEYEDGDLKNSGWATGDWNGDKEFNTEDFVLAFQDGGYEQGQRPAVAAVPEPSAVGLLFVAGLLSGIARRRSGRDLSSNA